MNQYKTFPQAYALIIAIAEYEGVNALPSIVTKDACDVASILTAENYCGYEASKVKMLLNSEATLENIKNEIIKIAQKATSDDSVFIYFSGHGYNKSDAANPDCSLVPVDFNQPDGGMLSATELSSLLSNIHSERLLFIIDACHSAGVATIKNFTPNVTLGFSDKSLEKLSQGRGKVLIASSRDSETSIILPGDKNSLFTKHFLSALKGEAGSSNEDVVRVFDIFSYLEKKVSVEAATRNHPQHPVFKSNLENNFPVALRCGGIVKQVSTGETTISLIRDKKLEDILAELYPAGPIDQDIWQRAGGDISRLRLNGTGRAQWFSALRILKQGGGGENISIDSLILEVKNDFPNHPSLI
ncbi:caspase family protein [Acinetobacter higginsii]|uniref:caspase family protein n=1 Tax=Acinetobacter higginsii TaxID=70347 RepID=UPI001F4BC271|nr:caspase family protein [Acinetobacter higginsii]MCH7341488.1 caspase family protein [Acinetobacter higginsii]